MQWGPVKRRKESQRTAVVLKVQLCTLINFFFLIIGTLNSRVQITHWTYKRYSREGRSTA